MHPPYEDEHKEAFRRQPNVMAPELLAEQIETLEGRYWESYEGHIKTAQETRIALQEEAMYGDVYIEELYRQNDALGYQRRYKEARERGASEAELAELAAARRVNIVTGFNEAMNALDFDLSEPLIYDVEEDGRISHGGMYVDEMYLRSLTPVNCATELDRREIESASNAAWQNVAWDEGATDVGRIDISMRNTDPAAIGYVEEIDKLQIRFSKFVDTPDGRKLHTQALLINGLNMGDDFMNDFLRHIGHIDADEPDLNRTDILARPVIAPLSEIDGPIGFVRSMDDFRYKTQGVRTIVGVDADLRPDLTYGSLEAIAADRRAKTVDAVEDIDAYAQSLVDDEIPYEDAEMKLEAYQKRWALDICRTQPDLAKKVFNHDTYEQLKRVQQLEEQGYHGAAQEVFGEAYEQAPNLMGCGATCRLEVAGIGEQILADAKGLKAYDLSGELWVDKKAVCPSCNKSGMLRGENGIICLNKDCGDDKINGVEHTSGNRSKESSSGKEDIPWYKSFAAVQAEYELNQKRKQA